MIGPRFQKLFDLSQSRAAFAAGDQILLSATNFLISLFVLKFEGVESLGVYSFLTVFVMLGHGASASVLHGQMTLKLAGSRFRVKQSFFKSTVVLYLGLFAVVLSLVALCSLLFDLSFGGIDYTTLSILSCFNFGFYSLFDLSKRYLYLHGLQRQSFFLTLIYTVFLFAFLVFLAFRQDQNWNDLALVMFFNSSAFLIALLCNKYFVKAVLEGKRQSVQRNLKLFSVYMEQGRYGLGGTLVTWIQNQSITPILMFFSGPLVVGFFNIARLIMMPIVVVNTGLLASALPKLRELAKKDAFGELSQKILMFSFLNLLVCGGYIFVIVVAHLLELSDRFITDYREVLPFLVVWSVVIVVITIRSWMTQHFIVRMKFEYLLVTSVISALLTLSSMVIFYFFSGSYYTMAAAVLVGDIYLLVVFMKKLSAQKVVR